MRLVWGIDEAIANYVGGHFPKVWERGGFRSYMAVGIATGDGKTVGGIVLSEFHGHDGTLNIFLERPCLTAPMLRELCAHVFRKVRMKRITAHCEKKNRRARKLVEGIGFRFEGTMRYGGENGDDDLVIYGMTYDNCRWLK